MKKFFYLLFCFYITIGSVDFAHARTGLFGSDEFVSRDLSIFPKWTGMVKRMQSDKVVDERQCAENTPYCYYRKWERFTASLKGETRLEQLRGVQAFANEMQYIIDPVNWQVPDYWATPRQFFMKDGDCEDYAIMKFMTLRALGVPNRDMRIVVLNDENLNTLHAVLTVDLGGKTYMLDNQIDQVVTVDRIHHYRPIYSINETTWWRHSF